MQVDLATAASLPQNCVGVPVAERPPHSDQRAGAGPRERGAARGPLSAVEAESLWQ